MPESTETKRVTAFLGTASKKHTYAAVQALFERFEASGDQRQLLLSSSAD